jgi:hypothetical protein
LKYVLLACGTALKGVDAGFGLCVCLSEGDFVDSNYLNHRLEALDGRSLGTVDWDGV